ncbi:flagellar hook-basal body complex protein [Boseaceae bacterium BT-24-1]|nr:flagellar hook-basal body complex protein [Boseaceae bacterium BT-24-1]
MSISTAMQSAIGGMRAQSYAISNISGNIANAQTPGYKRIDTNFSDLLVEQARKRTVAGSVIAEASFTASLQGPIRPTAVPTNMAINGQGFFTVLEKTGDANGQARFSREFLYTRRGDFALNQDGYLVNGAGAFLLGNTVDPASGAVTFSGPIRILNPTVPGRATSTIEYSANLPKTPATATSANGDETPYTVASAVVTDPTLATPDISKKVSGAAQAPVFLAKSIMGPSLTAFTSAGSPVSISTRWAKVQDAAPAAAPPRNSVWNLFYASHSASPKDSDWTNAGSAFSFDATGKFVPPASAIVAGDGGVSLKIPQMVIDGANLGDVTLKLGAGALTQSPSGTGAVTTHMLSQDGYALGTLKNLSTTPEGSIVGSFANDRTAVLATAGIVNFRNPNGLKAASGGNFVQTRESGVPMAGLNGATIVGSSIEGSNGDIAGEFSKLIATQQAYSANTKVMTSAQQMMTELLNIIR